jgi:hypothetical protein
MMKNNMCEREGGYQCMLFTGGASGSTTSGAFFDSPIGNKHFLMQTKLDVSKFRHLSSQGTNLFARSVR